MENRIKGKSIKINYEDVLGFFENHGAEKPLKHRYNYVLMQDEQPELTVERDKFEKEHITSVIKLEPEDYVLDIGCGIGRWGEEILSRGAHYIGVDFSRQLLHIAKENLKNYGENYLLIQSSFQELTHKLKENNITRKFDKIFINGIFMYINDDDLQTCFSQIPMVAKEEKCTIFLKESVGTEERLNLNKIYSEELKSEYTAIYRIVQDYRVLISKYLVKENNFKILCSEDSFPNELKNRAETKDYHFILER